MNRPASPYPQRPDRSPTLTLNNHYCDRCACLITSERSVLDVASGPLMRRFEEIEVCRPCGEALVAWLNASALDRPPIEAPAAKLAG